MYLTARLHNFWFLVKNQRLRTIAKKIQFRMYSDTHSYGLRRDLSLPIPHQPSKIPLTIRRLTSADIPKVFDFKDPKSTKQYKRDLLARYEHLNAKIPTCYIAVTGEDTPVYIQWLMGHTENAKIQAYFNEIFPWLAPDEVLLENALTVEQFRNQGVKSAAMACIAECGKEIGARWALTFIAEHNIPSLKGAKRAGFYPYMIRHERWIFFFRSISFTKLPPNTPYPFDKQISESVLQEH